MDSRAALDRVALACFLGEGTALLQVLAMVT
jgi:hypothetical protein